MTLAINRTADILYAVHSSDIIADDEWEQLLREFQTMIDQTGRVRMLVDNTGAGGPSVKQRMRLKEASAGNDVKVAVIAENRIVRGLVKAIAWVVDIPIDTFSREKIMDAVRFLGPELDADDALRKLHYLGKTLES